MLLLPVIVCNDSLLIESQDVVSFIEMKVEVLHFIALWGIRRHKNLTFFFYKEFSFLITKFNNLIF